MSRYILDGACEVARIADVSVEGNPDILMVYFPQARVGYHLSLEQAAEFLAAVRDELCPEMLESIK